MSEVNTVLGLPLEWTDDPEVTVTPYSALVVMKGINSNGNEVFAVVNTTGLTNVEALGFLNFAKLYIEDEVRAELYQQFQASNDDSPPEKK